MASEQTPALLHKYRKPRFALSLGAFVCFAHLYLFQPMLPDLARAFDVSATLVNWVLASATLALALGLLPWAILSEKYGRRPFMLMSLYAIPVISLLMLSASNLHALIFLRALLGLFLGSYVAIASAYMAEEFPPQVFIAAMGAYVAANALGGITGRVYGGLATSYLDWKYALLILSLVTIVAAFYVHKHLPKQRNFVASDANFKQETQKAIRHLTNPKLWIAMLIGGLNFALFVNLYSVMGFRLTAPPYNYPVGISAMIFLCYFAGTISAQLTSIWRKHYRATQGMCMGSIISLLGMFITSAAHPLAMIAGLLLISFGAFFTHAMAYAWVSQHAQQAKASASALYLIHYYTGGSLGGFLLLYCWEVFAWHGVIYAASCLYLLLFVAIWRLSRYNQIA